MRLLGSFKFDSFSYLWQYMFINREACNQCRMDNFIASVNEFSLFTLDFLKFVVIII